LALTTTYSNIAVVTIYTALSPPNGSLSLMMEVSFSEQFSNACNGNTECIRAVGSFMGICFNKKLAIAAIEATATDNNQSNTRHMLEIQKCIFEKQD